VAEEANYSGNKFHKSGKHFALSTDGIVKYGSRIAGKFAPKFKKLGIVAGKAAPWMTAVTVVLFLSNPKQAIADEMGMDTNDIDRLLAGQGYIALKPSLYKTRAEGAQSLFNGGRFDQEIYEGKRIAVFGPDRQEIDQYTIQRIYYAGAVGVYDVRMTRKSDGRDLWLNSLECWPRPIPGYKK